LFPDAPLNGDEFDSGRFRRARRLRPSEDTELDFASPEDVILKKMAFLRGGRSPGLGSRRPGLSEDPGKGNPAENE
jgi:hypothetical protein